MSFENCDTGMNDKFIELLKQKTIEKESCSIPMKESCPTDQMFYDYALNYEDDDTQKFINDHIIKCHKCALRLLHIMMILHDHEGPL